MELIISQEQFKQNQINGRRIREIKTNKKEQKRIERVSKQIIVGCLLGIALLWILYASATLKNKGIQGCMSNGYSYNYCIEHS